VAATSDCPKFDGATGPKIRVARNQRVQPCHVSREVQGGRDIGHRIGRRVVAGPGLNGLHGPRKRSHNTRETDKGPTPVGNDVVGSSMDVEDVDGLGGYAAARVKECHSGQAGNARDEVR